MFEAGTAAVGRRVHRPPWPVTRECPSTRQREYGLGGGRRDEMTRREVMAELEEALLGRLPGGVNGVKATSAAAGTAEDINSESVLVERCPVEAPGGLARLRLSLR